MREQTIFCRAFPNRTSGVEIATGRPYFVSPRLQKKLQRPLPVTGHADNFCHTTPTKTDCVGSLAPCRDSRVISFTSSYSLLSLITLLSLGPYRVFSFSFLHPLSFSKKTNFRIGWMGIATPTFWFSVPLLPPPPPVFFSSISVLFLALKYSIGSWRHCRFLF